MNAGTTQTNQKKQQPRRVKENARGETDCRDSLLNEPAGHLNQHHPVGALHARAFHLVGKDRILESSQVQARGVLHDSRADVAGKLVREDAVTEIDQPSEDRRENGEAEFKNHQPPEVSRQCKMSRRQRINGIDDDARYSQQGDRNQRDQQTQEKTRGNRLGRRFPDHSK